MGAALALWTRLRPWLLLLVGLYGVVVLLAWIFQRHLIYFPDPRPVSRPGGRGWADLQELELATADGLTLHAWYLPGARPGTVLFFHGNAGNRGDRLFLLEGFRRLGVGVLMPDYRGYGGSEGRPSEEGFRADARSARAWLQAHTTGPVVYVGNSIGCGVACDLASHHAPAGLVLQSPFTSLPDVAGDAYPWLPAGWILRDRFDNLGKIGALGCPVLILHGTADRIIPMAHGRRLFEAAADPKDWVPVAGAGHNDLVATAGSAYWERLDRFLQVAFSR